MGMKLIKFGAKWCAPCQSMTKAKVFERFKEKHPDVEVKLFDLPGEDEVAALDGLKEDMPDDQIPAELKPFAEAEHEAEDYEVEGLPTIIFEDENGDELARGDEAMSLTSLEKLYKEALEAQKTG